MGRRTKTLLPTTKELLLPKTIQASTVRNAIAQRQQRQKYYYDRLAQPLSQLSIGDSVTFQCNKTWKRARITGVSEAPVPTGLQHQKGKHTGEIGDTLGAPKLTSNLTSTTMVQEQRLVTCKTPPMLHHQAIW